MKFLLEKIFQFTQSENGERSSRRLTYLASAVIFSLGSCVIVGTLIHKGEFESAKDIWGMFGVFTGASGGFVTADLLTKFKSSKKK